MSMNRNYQSVTELSGEEVSCEQVERLAHRYLWAAGQSAGKEVLEVACGPGQGLALLAGSARRLWAGDVTPALARQAHAVMGTRAGILELDAQKLPFPESSLDVVILFEALYYLPDAKDFLAECRRVLRPEGQVLIASANPDLWDFNPSPFSTRYYGVAGLTDLFAAAGFAPAFFGHLPTDAVSWRQRLFRPVKTLAAALGLIPPTMAGKKWLKRLVFGSLVSMPASIGAADTAWSDPVPLPAGQADRRFKVIYAAAVRRPDASPIA